MPDRVLDSESCFVWRFDRECLVFAQASSWAVQSARATNHLPFFTASAQINTANPPGAGQIRKAERKSSRRRAGTGIRKGNVRQTQNNAVVISASRVPSLVVHGLDKIDKKRDEKTTKPPVEKCLNLRDVKEKRQTVGESLGLRSRKLLENTSSRALTRRYSEDV